ncbi:KDO2-lipid IV(A) lauroyltransferase [Lewinella aquimaris]|uniref:KDO2-lipid IV(A) lauroyltransferase n=1 Tax=Neolewinella aquimaris TaxID=1835722 RepID=A0A840EAJ3_9BACT|nr:lysophospholipid acyltransferase family protein [Neolewinella aquimaris]MBB4080963.1 KDO2-lipid IV(A) lauroyltransferase [Neolewinella aquimaris]
MAYLLYYLLLRPLSFLPLGWLYRLSDLLYLIGYRWIGYRREVVLDNLRRAFPEWEEEKVRTQARRFYHYFFDSIVESVKNYSMSEAESIRRLRVVNPEIVAPHAAANQSCILYGAHYSNWEIGGLSFPSQFAPANVVAIYSPLKNETMDRLTRHNRERTGVTMLSRRKVYEYFAGDELRPAVDIFVADQSPSNAVWQKLHWTTFLGRTTAFLAGPERFAVRYDRPVYYINLRRNARGYYSSKIYRVTDTPRDEAPGYITECFVRHLEHEILRDPTPWLWTHRRWKREVPQEVERLLKTRPYLPAEYDPIPDRR